MHVINNINAKTFSHNGRNYVKNFIVIKQGENNIAIHNAYDTKFQLVGSTHFSQFQVNGVVYTSQADLMANLVNILFVKNLGNGAISNTSELINDGADGINPFVTVADLPSANKILNQTGYNLSGETLTINADWVWLIANQQYTNPAEVVINIPLASSGMTRIDLIVADNNNTFQRIAGTEAIDNAIAPPVPNNTIQATLIVVTDGIIETEPTPVGDLYLEKLDEGIGYLGSSSGIMANFILKKYTNYIIQNTSSVTQINSASFLSPVFSYFGKRIRITNQQSTPIVFKHNFGAGELKFDLINDTDYILGTDETINFIIQDDYTLLHVAEINIDNLPIPTLQEVTDAGNTTSNVIVGNNGFTTSDAHSNFEIATNYTTGTRQLNFFISGDDVDFPATDSAQIFTNLDDGTRITSTLGGNTTHLYVNGYDQGVRIGSTIGATSDKFAILKTGLISGGTKSFEFPNQSGTIALTSDLSSASSAVWKKSGLSTNANLVNEKIYRQNSVNLIGSTINFGTAPTQSDLDNEILGTQFGHIFGGGTVPFIQLLASGGNGSAGTNNFIGRFPSASTSQQQMTFSAIKSTAYDAWNDSNRALFRFQDGYLTPQTKLLIGTDFIQIPSYPSTRNDSGDSINNILFTNASGVLKSRPLSAITSNLVTTNTTQTVTGKKTFNDVGLIRKNATNLFPNQSGGSFSIGGNGNYDSFDFYSFDGTEGDGFGFAQIYSNPEEGNAMSHISLDNQISSILNINQYDTFLRNNFNGNRTSLYIDGQNNKVKIEGTINKFATLGTSLITGTQNFEFPNQSGTLALKSDVDNKISKHTGTTYTTNAIQTVTQAEYDAIPVKDATTIYFIV